MRKSLPHVLVLLATYSLGFLHGHRTQVPAPTAAVAPVSSATSGSLTDSLMHAFQQAWNADDLPGMLAQIHSNAFFRSPFQLRYGRDAMAKTVLTSNPKVFRNSMNTETHSFASDQIAWSIGTTRSDVFDAAGERTNDHLDADYVYVFTPDAAGDGKIQMMIYHEKCG